MQFTYACSMLCAALIAGTACAGQASLSTSQHAPEFTIFAEGDEITSGYVILNGEYLSRPYLLVQKDNVLFINSRPLPSALLRTNAATDMASMVERTLQNDGLLIVNDDRVYFLGCERGHRVLDALASGASAAAMLAQIQTALGDNMSTAVVPWSALVQFATRDAKFVERLRTDLGMSSDDDGSPTGEVGAGTSLPQSLRFGMNAAGMVLAVLALGTVLMYRPEVRRKDSTVVDHGDGYKLLPRFVAVVLLLSVFDLVYTMTADRAGGLWEMNPLGSQLLHFPLALIAFKLSATLTGAGMLLWLRKYRTAQFASWCICLVYTVLTFRWAIFNSLFFG